MRFEVRVTEEAEKDLAGIARFLAEREGVMLAERVLDGNLDLANDLARYPERGSIPKELLDLGIREFRQVQFQPYRLIYRILGRQVFILLIADGRGDFKSLLERRILRMRLA